MPLQASAPSGAVTITATNRAAFVLDTGGRVWTWGSDAWDELGTGPGGSFSSLPVVVPGLNAVRAVHPGYWGGRAVLAD